LISRTMQIHEMKETCSLDIADRGGSSFEEMARHMNITRERVRQIALTAIAKMFDMMKEDL